MKRWIFAIAACSLASCNGSAPTADTNGKQESVKPQAKPGTLAAADSQIVNVDVFEETKHASVKVDLDQGWAESSLPSQVAMVLESAGKAIKAGGSEIPAENATINFWFTAPMEDGSRDKVMEFRIKTDDLRHNDYKSSTPQALLEYVSKPEVKYAARAGVDEYCSSNASSNPAFCAAVK